MKEFAPLEIFSFREDPFLEEWQKQLDKVTSPESVSIPLNP